MAVPSERTTLHFRSVLRGYAAGNSCMSGTESLRERADSSGVMKSGIPAGTLTLILNQRFRAKRSHNGQNCFPRVCEQFAGMPRTSDFSRRLGARVVRPGLGMLG